MAHAVERDTHAGVIISSPCTRIQAVIGHLILSARVLYSGGEGQKAIDIKPAVEWDSLNGSIVHYLRDISRFRRDRCGLGGNLYTFRGLSDLEPDIDVRLLVHFQHDVTSLIRPETRVRNGHLVSAGTKQRYGIFPARARRCCTLASGFRIRDFDGHSGDNFTRRIGYCSGDGWR